MIFAACIFLLLIPYGSAGRCHFFSSKIIPFDPLPGITFLSKTSNDPITVCESNPQCNYIRRHNFLDSELYHIDYVTYPTETIEEDIMVPNFMYNSYVCDPPPTTAPPSTSTTTASPEEQTTADSNCTFMNFGVIETIQFAENKSDIGMTLLDIVDCSDLTDCQEKCLQCREGSLQCNYIMFGVNGLDVFYHIDFAQHPNPSMTGGSESGYQSYKCQNSCEPPVECGEMIAGLVCPGHDLVHPIGQVENSDECKQNCASQPGCQSVIFLNATFPYEPLQNVCFLKNVNSSEYTASSLGQYVLSTNCM